MAGRFSNPLPQFSDSTPTMYAGSKLFFYATGTSTKLNTYTTKALSVANSNPIVLDSSGRIPSDIFLQDLEYKVVLAPSTDTDPPSSPIWTADPVSARDSALIAKTVTGSGSPSGAVAGTAGSASILPDFYWDYTNSILYVCTTTGIISTAVWTAVNATAAAAIVPMPQGYLTLTTATPIIATDVTAATSVYYTPYQGNLVPIYNGSSFNPTAFTELTLTLNASHVASNIYDVFIFSNSGVLTVVTGPSWSAGTAGSITAGSCARGTGAGGAALSRVNGVLTNAVQITGRNGATTYTIAANLATYVGSLFMDGTNGQISCHRTAGQSRKWGVWNAYNRVPVILQVQDPTASWAGAAASTRAANGASANSFTLFCGLAEEECEVLFAFDGKVTLSSGSGSNNSIGNGIGFNSTSASSGKLTTFTVQTSGSTNDIHTNTMVAAYTALPALGINVITALEVVYVAGGGNTFFGTTSMLMRGKYRG